MSLAVCIKKLTGEVFETKVDQQDLVKVLKQKAAEELEVPAICQVLWLNDVNQSIAQQCVPFLAQHLTDAINEATTSFSLSSMMACEEYKEVLMFAIPPPRVMECLKVVMTLLCASSRINIQQSSEGLPDLNESWNRDDPRSCKSILKNPAFPDAVLNFSEDICNGRLTDTQVKAVQSLMNATDFSVMTVGKSSVLCRYLANWALIALNLYDVMHWDSKSGAMKLEDELPFGAYTSGEGSLSLELVMDPEPIFSELQVANQPGFGSRAIVALEALGALAPKFPDRAIEALVQSLTKRNQAEAALGAIKKAWASPNPEIAEKLNQQMGNFLYLNFDRQYVLAAFEYLEPGHQRLLFHAAHGLASFGDEYCLKVFEQLEKEMEVDLVLECLVKAMFHPSTEHLGTHDPHSLRQVTETFLEVAKRAPDKAAERLALFLQVTEPPWVRARAASIAPKLTTEDHECLVKAFQESISDDLDSTKLCEMARAFGAISTARNPFVPALCADLLRRYNLPCHVLYTLQSMHLVDDDRVVRGLGKFLASFQVLFLDDEEVLPLALDLMKLAAKSDPSQCSKVYIQLMRNLAKMLAQPGREKKELREALLLKIAEEQGGANTTVLRQLVAGFYSSIEHVRQRCADILMKIWKSESTSLVELLLPVVDERINLGSCCFAIQQIESLDPASRAEAMEHFTKMLEVETNCLVKSALLRAVTSGEVSLKLQETARLLTQDPVDTVRLDALQLLENTDFEGKNFQVLLQCLKDPAVSVSLVAFGILNYLPSERIDTEEVALVVSDLLTHPDVRMRMASTEALGRMVKGGKDIALAVLLTQELSQELWPELDMELRQKRHDVIAALGKS